MKSEIENFLSKWIIHMRRAALSYDRGVFVGAVLAFVPIFPACFFGMLLSLLNVGFALNNRLDYRNRRAAIFGACVGAFFTLIWWRALGSLSGAGIVDMIMSFIYSVFEFIYDVPTGIQSRNDEFV